MRYATLVRDDYGQYVVVIFNHRPTEVEKNAIVQECCLDEEAVVVDTVEVGDLSDNTIHVIVFEEDLLDEGLTEMEV